VGSPALRREARTFVLGAACGFLAGIFVLSAVVWQYGNVIGSRTASLEHPADAPAAVARWSDGSDADDIGDPVLLPADGPPSAGMSGGPTPPAPSPEPVIRAPASSPSELADRSLRIPVDGIGRDQLTRSFDERRSGNRAHQAIDILAPRHTPVRAVEDGTIARLFHSRAGGITIYQFDPAERYCYYYAHLERYAEGLQEGQQVRKGQLLGYVGTSGNAPPDTPHLHFAVYRLSEAKRWWEGTPIDPYEVLSR
jgi:peptidoglycan LD-endopeptidase LytH